MGLLRNECTQTESTCNSQSLWRNVIADGPLTTWDIIRTMISANKVIDSGGGGRCLTLFARWQPAL